ncbi:MAG: aromatic acid decarboxylase [Nitrospirae bacterium CG_4_9_14_3_um_filter_53_35]|nr:MAG: aromatic acid decarboxylase [Nitrospirae bacterium CG2_30_53_67]PIS37983.1 MAG: aromatic acid decarboxylase [Nitrospirae bacterium CG08_land_8_20_14_0_20_52_24]PIX85922.1 MAG: aromatic acid decarboxylase [Nitrospirae bacterium CG_4_10_14_3_um_filter_53_41]PJA77390.1 MAG: aromatic acid decarboxylase [Nitrospirae bacterium CG_4_9_14_3_um_filter_53_35]
MSHKNHHKKWILGISGASGAVYGLRLLEVLNRKGRDVDLILSDAGKIVIREETGIDLLKGKEDPRKVLKKKLGINPASIRVFNNYDFETPAASGSNPVEGMIIAPCSMGTLAAVACGLADNLMRRAADVMIKQKKPLILVARETPLSAVHLENMLKLSRLGVVILPPMPAFYHHPKTIEELTDFVVGRVLDVIGIEHELYQRWQGERPDL